MTTQPQAPVTVTPSLPNRRNSELLLLGFAGVITATAFAIVQANQERGIGWALVDYAAGFMAVFGVAHLAIRRYAQYADPLLLPIVALLNGLGLVMIHRLDLDERLTEGSGRAVTNPQILWTLVGVGAFAFVVIALKDHRQLARYGYVCGLTGLVILAIPALLSLLNSRRSCC